MKALLMTAAVLIAFSTPAMAQDKEMRITADAVKWNDNAAFPKGVQTAVLVGEPTRPGDVVVMRTKFPRNFQNAHASLLRSGDDHQR